MSTITITDQASAKQTAFLKSLVTARDLTGLSNNVMDVVMDILAEEPISKREASAAITALTAAPKLTATIATPDGIYILDDDVVEVTTGRTGRQYAKRLQGTSFQYEAGLIFKLAGARPATRDEVAAYGRRTGVCGCCGRTLTDPKSIAAGIGPICASRY